MSARDGTSAKALLLTTLGELVLPHDGVAWTHTLLTVLGLLGVSERNARQALARLGDQGLIRSVRHGREARWRLTPDGRELLVTGTERIYTFGRSDAEWDEHWLVVLCSVPEEHRAKRHRLRSRLAFEGFGFVGPGVAITPHLERERAANVILKDLDLATDAIVLRAQTGALVPAAELLDRAWDLEALAERYRRFTDAFARRAPKSDEGRLVALLELVDEWRRFPFVDPEIPDRLLSRTWPGRRARELFEARHATWSVAARRCYLAIEVR